MARQLASSVSYVNTRYYRAGGRRRRHKRSRSLTFVPAALLLVATWFGFSWYQDVITGEQDCSPFCGIVPGPGGPAEEATFDSARGWFVTYRKDLFGRPYREDQQGIEWRFADSQSVGIASVSETDPRSSCAAAAAALPSGFDPIYTIPNAGVGNQVGVGTAFEKTIARPGKAPVRIRHFQICVTAGDVGVIGFAEGPRERKPEANHANPATTQTAFLLGELTAAVEYVDEGGKPLSSSGES